MHIAQGNTLGLYGIEYTRPTRAKAQLFRCNSMLLPLQGVSFLSINANQGVFPLSSWKGQYVHVFYQLLPREPSHADVGERLQTDL